METTKSRALLSFCIILVSCSAALAENWNVELIDFYNPVNTWAYKVHIFGNYAYVAYKKGLRVINVSTPSALDKDRVGFCLTNPEAQDDYTRILRSNPALVDTRVRRRFYLS